jgi:DNA-binding transcriptional ArsR family regulator
MDVAGHIGAVGALIGDATRAQMLAALLDGRARTASELAWIADVAPSTASVHLKKLLDAGLVVLERQGRHRYFRLHGAELAGALESLLRIELRRDAGRPSGPRNPRMHEARTCYDHLAGRVAVDVAGTLVARRWLVEGEREFTVTGPGETWFAALGIEVTELAAGRRKLAPRCLDWSERRPHLAGALGAALLTALEAHRFIQREPDERTVRITSRGRRWLARELDVSVPAG